MEKWDAYNKDGSKSGFDLLRGAPIPIGAYQIVSEVLVKHVDGSFLLMQRDWNKEGYPGFFEAGASGGVLKGESPYQGAARELFEETGIVSNDLTLVFAQSNMKDTFFYGFLCTANCPKESIVLQEGETISYRWLNEAEFLKFMHGEEFVPTQRERWLPFLNNI